MTEQDLQDLIKEAKEAGASDAKKVDIASVKLAAWPRMKCQFGCPNYGNTLCCPPYTPELPFMKQFIGEYKMASSSSTPSHSPKKTAKTGPKSTQASQTAFSKYC